MIACSKARAVKLCEPAGKHDIKARVTPGFYNFADDTPQRDAPEKNVIILFKNAILKMLFGVKGSNMICCYTMYFFKPILQLGWKECAGQV